MSYGLQGADDEHNLSEEKENNPKLANNTANSNAEPIVVNDDDDNDLKLKLSDSEDSRSSSDASRKRTDKRKLSEASDLISEGEKPPKKAQRKGKDDEAEPKCNGEDNKDDVMVISDDEEDDKKDTKSNGNIEVKKEGQGDSKQVKTEHHCDVKTDDNTQVKDDPDDKTEGKEENEDKSTVSKSIKQQLTVDCNVIERLDGGEIIPTNVLGDGADSPNTLKLKTEALANVRAAKVSIYDWMISILMHPSNLCRCNIFNYL